MSYQEFLEGKKSLVQTVGFEYHDLPSCLFEHQTAIVKWALLKGRAAIFAGTGLGKSLMELAWADAVHKHTGHHVIILAPLSVAQQLQREADTFGLQGKYFKSQADAADYPIVITNYEKLHKFDLSKYHAVVLDESSCLKAMDGAKAALLPGTWVVDDNGMKVAERKQDGAE